MTSVARLANVPTVDEHVSTMAKNKQRRKQSPNQESKAAHGTITDVRRNMQRATGRSDTAMKWVIWGAGAMVVLALLWALLTPA